MESIFGEKFPYKSTRNSWGGGSTRGFLTEALPDTSEGEEQEDEGADTDGDDQVPGPSSPRLQLHSQTGREYYISCHLGQCFNLL